MDYVETSLLLSSLIENDINNRLARAILERADDPVTSELTILEATAVLSRIIEHIELPEEIVLQVVERPEVAVDSLVMYAMRRENIRVMEVEHYTLSIYGIRTLKIVKKAMEIAKALRLKTLDLLHVVYAEEIGANRILTLDKEMAKRGKMIRKLTGIEVIHDVRQ